MKTLNFKNARQAGMTMIEYLVLGVLVIAMITTIFSTIKEAVKGKADALGAELQKGP